MMNLSVENIGDLALVSAKAGLCRAKPRSNYAKL
jgi:hypothetical protein